MRLNRAVHIIIVVLGLVFQRGSAGENLSALPSLRNPMSEGYLQQHLSPEYPRLVYTPEVVEILRDGVKTDSVLKNMYAAIRLNVNSILNQPLLKRKMTGRRLLHVSREMLYRVNMLGVVGLIEEDAAVLTRIDQEILSVCRFADWNPDHYLDVAEMSLAVALALDWTHGRLPDSTVSIAKTALIEKGLRPSWSEDGIRWKYAYGDNNWNQVCNGGMIAAALAVASDEPELAAKTIHRALDGMPYALRQYAPDGVYPEGSSYWRYGTSFTVMTAAMLGSALGDDFGLYAVPGLKESALFRLLSIAPSGLYYNFFDCRDRREGKGDTVLAWFAVKSGDSTFFEKDRFLQPAEDMGKLNRLDGAALAWISQFSPSRSCEIPVAWKGNGENPIAIFRSKDDAPYRYYFGGKGGQASSSHGNMDAGSFVFELDGLRWVRDSGNQDYHQLEQTGFDLWGRSQTSERWTLLTKNNFGHSTITVNDELFLVDGFASLVDFGDGDKPRASFDLSAVYGSNVLSAVRLFSKDGPASLVIEDQIMVSSNTRTITWQLMTTAKVEPVEGGAILRQDGRRLMLENQSHPELKVSVVELDPPPLKLDRRINGLKRVEIQIPAQIAVNGKISFKVRLAEGDK